MLNIQRRRFFEKRDSPGEVTFYNSIMVLADKHNSFNSVVKVSDWSNRLTNFNIQDNGGSVSNDIFRVDVLTEGEAKNIFSRFILLDVGYFNVSVFYKDYYNLLKNY